MKKKRTRKRKSFNPRWQRRQPSRVGMFGSSGFPHLTMQEEGLTKGTSCPSYRPMSGAS